MSGSTWTARKDGDAPAKEERYQIHPYYGFDWAGSDQWFADDAAYFATEESEITYDVIVFGGSVAAGFVEHGAAQLNELLRRDPAFQGRPVRVMGSARGTFRQPQLLHMLEYALEMGLRPDAVVELDGFNEVAIGLDNAARGLHPALPTATAWTPLVDGAPITTETIDALASMRGAQLSARAWVDRGERLGLFHSAIASRIVASRINGDYARFAAAFGRYQALQEPGENLAYTVGPTFDASEEAVLDTCARVWVQSSIAMNAVCRAFGIRYVHLLQPTLHDAGSKPVTDEERRKGAEPAIWARGVELGYPKLRAASAELTAAGVEFVDLSRAFADVHESLYYDVCHFTPAGYAIVVPQVATVLCRPAPEAQAKAGGKRRKRAENK
jgi:hypothetical protein